jgi:two-component system, response regulator YesN
MRTAVIVDDEELSVDILKYLIQRYELPIEVVGEAFSGDEGFKLINSLKPDIVFIDIKMPVMNGLEVIEKVNAEQKSDICFIVVTAYDYFEYAQTALRLGAKDILLKPIEPELFLETVERVLDYKKSYNKIFDQILEYINCNYCEDMELKHCAEMYHTSSSYIARMFKKYSNTTFSAYLNDLRMKKAKELLKDSDLTIKEVSYKAGYNNLNYFYKIFKKSTGMTPNMFKSKEK